MHISEEDLQIQKKDSFSYCRPTCHFLVDHVDGAGIAHPHRVLCLCAAGQIGKEEQIGIGSTVGKEIW